MGLLVSSVDQLSPFRRAQAQEAIGDHLAHIRAKALLLGAQPTAAAPEAVRPARPGLRVKAAGKGYAIYHPAAARLQAASQIPVMVAPPRRPSARSAPHRRPPAARPDASWYLGGAARSRPPSWRL
jgi:hypothetical protein